MSNLIERFNKTSIVTRWLIYIVSLCALCTLTLHFIKVDIKYDVVANNKVQLPDVAVNKNVNSGPTVTPQKPQTRLTFFLNRFIYSEGLVDGDSWMPMACALDFIQTHPGQPVYETFFKKGIKFQYPLSSLLVFDIPHRLTGASFSLITYWLNLLSAISVFGFGCVCAIILFKILKQPELKILNGSYNSKTLQCFLILVLTCLLYPITYSYKIGQIQTILTLCTAIVILCWLYDKKILAGIILGVICIIKPQLALLFFWALIRRQWNMVIASGITITILLLISFQLYGFNANLHYLQVLSFLSHHGEAYYANQSVNGLLNRLLFNWQNLIWDGVFPPYSSTIYSITLVTSLIFIASGLSWNYKARKPGVIDLCIMILCTTMASPIAWEHHYAIVLAIFIVLSPFVLYFCADKKWILIVLSLSYLLVSLNIEFVKLFAKTNLNILQSYLFFGACIILSFLFVIARKIQKRSIQI